MSRLTRARINLDALGHNVAQARALAPQSALMAVLKANAYGHGLLPIAHELSNQVEAFAVSCLEEALPLRAAGLNHRIVLLEGFFQADEIPVFAAQRFDAVIHHPWQIEALEQAELPVPIDCWLKVDTGMGRLGFAPRDAPAAAERLRRCSHVGALRWMTHFANADQPEHAETATQLARFGEVINPDDSASAANSAATLRWPSTHQDWVRPGIMLYGSSPFADPASHQALAPVMQLEAPLISVKWLPAGHGVGYGGRFVCPERMPVGVVGVGYGDGYPRHAPDGTPVYVNGVTATVIGKVSMDMLGIDLRSVPQPRVGDRVILWGDHPTAGVVAEHCGTISYELFCQLTPRVQRIYRRGGDSG